MNNKCETTNASDGASVNKVNYDLQPSGPHSLKTKKTFSKDDTGNVSCDGLPISRTFQVCASWLATKYEINLPLFSQRYRM